MQPDYLRYLREHDAVDGWLSDETIALTALLDRDQAGHGVGGSIAEIGVHHGKYFVALCLLRREGEKALALDVFEDQGANVDGSGKGDREILEANLARHVGSLEGIEILKADSLEAKPKDLLARLGGPTRLFSVDGGHTVRHAMSDLHLAEAVSVDAGVVVLDDFFHYYWPGVTEGAIEYLRATAGRGLVPFCLASNKLYLAKPDAARHYFDLLIAAPGTVGGQEVELCGHRFLTLSARPLGVALAHPAPDVLRLAQEARTEEAIFALGLVEAAIALPLEGRDGVLAELGELYAELSIECGNVARTEEMILRFREALGRRPMLEDLARRLEESRPGTQPA